MSKFIAGVKKFVARDEAATMLEYGLMVALIAVVCIGAVTAIGVAINNNFVNVQNAVGGGQ